MKVIRLVVFCIQDSAISMHIGYKHEDALKGKKKKDVMHCDNSQTSTKTPSMSHVHTLLFHIVAIGRICFFKNHLKTVIMYLLRAPNIHICIWIAEVGVV